MCLRCGHFMRNYINRLILHTVSLWSVCRCKRGAACMLGGVVLVALCEKEVNDNGKEGEDLWPWNSAFHFAGALQTSWPESCKWCSKTGESNGQFACAKWRRNARAEVPRYCRLYQFTQAFKIIFLLDDFLTFLLWLF